MAASTCRCCSSLPDEILIEIFTYLPLTSIYRFKSVSKVWLSNLSNPNFITKWLQLNYKSIPWIQYHTHTPHYEEFINAYPDSHLQFISRNDYGFSFRFLRNGKPYFQRAEFYLLGSSNGLVLFFSLLTFKGKYHVCNPLTQKLVTIPSPPLGHAGKYAYIGIFCENSLSAGCCYKVVCIQKFWCSKKFIVDMFNSDLGTWRSVEVSCDQDVSAWLIHKNPIILNGVLFLLEKSDRMLIYNLNQNNGCDGHRCSLIDLPGPRFRWNKFDEFNNFNSRTFGESEGRICYAIAGVTRRQISVSVWVLDEEKWQMLHKDILVDDSFAEICFGICDAGSIQISGFSPVDRNVILLSREHWVWWYNIQSKSFEELKHSSVLTNRQLGSMYESFVLKTMPTILPPPSWTAEDVL